MSYQDNENSALIIEELKSCTTPLDLLNLIYKEFPDWILHVVSSYSIDYPSLQQNWFNVLIETNKKSGFNATPQAILLVSQLQFGTTYTTITSMCELLTIMGYVVRRSSEFVICPVCTRAIPCKKLFNTLVSMNKPHPIEWNSSCENC